MFVLLLVVNIMLTAASGRIQRIIYIYIYIERERERYKPATNNIYIYIYIYMISKTQLLVNLALKAPRVRRGKVRCPTRVVRNWTSVRGD